MPSDTWIRHDDEFAFDLSPQSEEFETSYQFAAHPEKIGYGDVSKRGSDIDVVHPLPNVEKLTLQKHLEAQLHEHNRTYWEARPIPNDGTTLYDLAILDAADTILAYEGISYEEFDILNRRFKLIFLENARHAPNKKEFYRYIKDSEVVLSELGYRNPTDLVGYNQYRTFHSVIDDLSNGWDTLEPACIRTIYTVYRHGIKPPQQVIDAYGFDDVEPPLEDWKLPRDPRQYALREWVNVLTDETLGPLTFGRSDPAISLFEYLGLLATSALTNSGLQTAADLSDWNYPRENFPKGSGLPRHISNRLELNNPPGTQGSPGINQQFDAVHSATLELANELGCFDPPVSLAVDLYKMPWTGSNEAPTISRTEKYMTDVTEEFVFVVVSILDKDARFTLGTRWLPDKAKYPAKVGEIFSQIPDYLTDDADHVETVYADAEMVGGALIDAIRRIAGPDWIIRAPERGLPEALEKATPSNYVGFVPGVSWNTTPKPNLIAYPDTTSDDEDDNDNDDDDKASSPSLIEFSPRQLKGDLSFPEINEQRTMTNYAESESPSAAYPRLDPIMQEFDVDDPSAVPGYGDNETHYIYLSDRSLPEQSPAGIHFPYYQRWGIEQSINQISNHFLPVLNSPDQKQRVYAVNIAILLQNWHTLIRRAISPDLGIRLSSTHQELLKAIQHVAFSPE